MEATAVLKLALRAIRGMGRVCEEFGEGDCQHPACNDSAGAAIVAGDALAYERHLTGACECESAGACREQRAIILAGFAELEGGVS